MKKRLKLTMMLAALALSFAACEKPDNPIGGDNDTTPKERVIVYTVSGNESCQTLRTEAEWDTMIEQFCNQAQNGNEVVFYNMSQTTYLQSKGNGTSASNRTINTTNREEMKRWMKDMEKQGLTVRVTYNENTGTWHGEAYATAPTTDTDTIITGCWLFNCMVMTQTDGNDHLLDIDLFVPDEEESPMYYTFYSNGTATISASSVGNITDTGTWSLSDDGELCCELLPGGGCWNVNWVTASTMIISRSDLNTEEGSFYYQIQFDAAPSVE